MIPDPDPGAILPARLSTAHRLPADPADVLPIVGDLGEVHATPTLPTGPPTVDDIADAHRDIPQVTTSQIAHVLGGDA